MGMSWANNPYAWTDAHVLAPLILGAGFLIGLVVHQTFLKKDGLFHHGLFKKDRNFALALFIILVDGIVFYVANVYYSYEVSVLYETNTELVGLHFCVAFFVAIMASVGAGFYASLWKSVRGPIVTSFLLFVIFYCKISSLSICRDPC